MIDVEEVSPANIFSHGVQLLRIAETLASHEDGDRHATPEVIAAASERLRDRVDRIANSVRGNRDKFPDDLPSQRMMLRNFAREIMEMLPE